MKFKLQKFDETWLKKMSYLGMSKYLEMIPKFDIQYLTDKDGNKTAVIIPINDWANITNSLAELIEYQTLKSKISSAFNEVSKMKEGKLSKVSLTDFLDTP